jgi:osmoprotectant transport system permease protein
VTPFEWAWLADNSGLVISKLVQHIQLTVIAVVVGFAISLPLGIYAFRHGHAYGPIAGVTGILYTIPSLALFAFFIPVTGLTTTTAEIGLVSYTLLILIRNIVSGLRGVPPDAREAALGMGHSSRELLWKVEMPLALPVIMAGVRLATVTTIGLVTVTALIGKGGFGALILQGFRFLQASPLVVGAVLSLALAITVDALLVAVERRMTPWTKVGSSKAVVAGGERG